MSEEQEEMTGGGELVYRVNDPSTISLRSEGEGAEAVDIIEGRMMPYDEWTQVESAIEARQLGIRGGKWLERFAPGSLAKTMQEQGPRIRALFEHGLDNLGRQAVASTRSFRDEADGAYFEAQLLRGLPELLVSGIRSGLYGTSIRFRPIKANISRNARRSEHNPEGLPEVTVREAFMREFSITAFPVYAGATAHLRSFTDEIAARQLLTDPERLLQIVEKRSEEPTHSVPEEQEDPAPQGSRVTRPSRDYLKDERKPRWRLT